VAKLYISEFNIDLNLTFVIVHFEETVTKIIQPLIKQIEFVDL